MKGVDSAIIQLQNDFIAAAMAKNDGTEFGAFHTGTLVSGTHAPTSRERSWVEQHQPVEIHACRGQGQRAHAATTRH